MRVKCLITESKACKASAAHSFVCVGRITIASTDDAASSVK